MLIQSRAVLIQVTQVSVDMSWVCLCVDQALMMVLRTEGKLRVRWIHKHCVFVVYLVLMIQSNVFLCSALGLQSPNNLYIVYWQEFPIRS